MQDILIIVAVLVMATLVRLLPHFMFTAGLGIDHWFWKLYIERLKEDKKFPPTIPEYTLDVHQWYPPVFPLIFKALPRIIFEKYSHLIAIFFDIGRMIVLLIFTFMLSNGSILAVAVAGLIYATIPLLISYNVQLNPRGIGALMLDMIVIILIYGYVFENDFWVWPSVVFLAGLVLLTHKMTTQLMWFLFICAGISLENWRFPALIPLSIIMAMVLSKGFYWKVAIAHWDIITFWNRNWRWLAANPVKESPIYGEPGYDTPNKLHRSGFGGFKRRTLFLLGFYPAIWVLLFTISISAMPKFGQPHMSNWLLLWIVYTLIFAIATTFIPWLKCLGAGYLYIYNTAVPSALLLGISILNDQGSTVTWIGVGVALFVNIAGIAMYLQKLQESKTQRIDSDFELVLDYLKSLPKGVVMCLPAHWYDVVAYKTRQPVLYGAHGYGFKKLEPVWPRLMVPIETLYKKYGARYLLTIDSYNTEKFLSSLKYSTVVEFGEYKVYSLTLK